MRYNTTFLALDVSRLSRGIYLRSALHEREGSGFAQVGGRTPMVSPFPVAASPGRERSFFIFCRCENDTVIRNGFYIHTTVDLRHAIAVERLNNLLPQHLGRFSRKASSFLEKKYASHRHFKRFAGYRHVRAIGGEYSPPTVLTSPNILCLE